MLKYKSMLDDESVFWKFAHEVIAQLDARPADERDDAPVSATAHCKHTSMGQYRIKEGTYKGCL